MAFENIVGQAHVIKLLKQSIKQNTVGHGYIFEGIEGLGKHLVAFELAKALCCTGTGDQPCNQCNSCKKLSHQNHPDVIWITGEGSIKINTIRDLQKDTQQKPYESRKKVYIIEKAEKMTVQAQNALLKTLEEPPSYVTLILLTANSHSLLPTITSRCQIIKFQPVPLDVIQAFLMLEKNVDLEKAKLMATLSNGVVGKALKLLEDPSFQNQREGLIQISKDLFKKDKVAALQKFSFFEDHKESIEEILELYLVWYRDLLVYRDTQNKVLMFNIDQVEEIISQSNRIDLKKISNIISIIENTKENVRRNVQFQLNIEVMLLNIQEVLSSW
ncbi:DNA polymerase III, delta prime subunit [Alkaliphilus metalliredigens QYMF]|uniref:DNA polymerase III subunit delta' n=1 Tax=Alkaliphilus metalliredigens (strain QYMF) TaxID=293826 RepID=A6TJF9_ALKMQ|nr:DNA polymerase III subunit delta' [Alkaliphilus metalliredigens]ABR46327.1 DNA polymerase III, delta prime subunit [Alkaliphilus metalliredigens QYMF]